MMLSIGPLADHLEHVATVARWHWDEWGHTDVGGSLASWTDGLATRIGRGTIPTTLVAILDGLPVGCASLVEHDMHTRRDLTPWVAGVFVVPSHRGRGIATALMQTVERDAVTMGFRELYLYTSSAERLYRGLGWRTVDREEYDGRVVAIMRKPLAPDVVE